MNRTYPLNENYFDIIDNEEKAYFLGLLYADGTNSTGKTEIKLELHNQDIEILDFYKNKLQPTKPLYFEHGKGKRGDTYKLVINSKKISYRLSDLGVVPSKTFKLKFPNFIEEHLIHHFVRGYFDGDGNIHYNKSCKQLMFSITSTENFLLSLQEILIKNCFLNKVKLGTRHPERKHNIRQLAYCGNNSVRRIYEWLYNDANIFLSRKKLYYDKYLSKL
jgi:intein/homing endonuclease